MKSNITINLEEISDEEFYNILTRIGLIFIEKEYKIKKWEIDYNLKEVIKNG